MKLVCPGDPQWPERLDELGGIPGRLSTSRRNLKIRRGQY
jgi:hypothetical protein